MEWVPHETENFTERMQRGRDGARERVQSLAYLGASVSYDRPALTLWRNVAEVAAYLGVGEHRVRQFLRRGAVLGAKRVKGEWRVPFRRQADGTYLLSVVRGKRGPKPGYVADVAPF